MLGMRGEKHNAALDMRTARGVRGKLTAIEFFDSPLDLLEPS
jgi:hypothetical protein